MRWEAGRQEALPAPKGCHAPSGVLRGLRLREVAMVMLVPRARPSLWPLPLLKPLSTPNTHTHTHTLKAENEPAQPLLHRWTD